MHWAPRKAVTASGAVTRALHGTELGRTHVTNPDRTLRAPPTPLQSISPLAQDRGSFSTLSPASM
jgi:hypothetical protein